MYSFLLSPRGQRYLARLAPLRLGRDLSTTTFALERFHLGPAGDVAMVDVVNTGSRDAPTVVQIYAGYETSAYERPRWRLVGFGRQDLRSGQRAALSIALDLRMLDVRVDGVMVRESGRVILRAAFHADDPGITTVSDVPTERVGN